MDLFARWKTHDARALEDELVDMATTLQASRWEKCGLAPPQELPPDLRAIAEGVERDVALLGSRVVRAQHCI